MLVTDRYQAVACCPCCCCCVHWLLTLLHPHTGPTLLLFVHIASNLNLWGRAQPSLQMDAGYARRPSRAANFNSKYTFAIRQASKMCCDTVKWEGGVCVFLALAILLKQRSRNIQNIADLVRCLSLLFLYAQYIKPLTGMQFPPPLQQSTDRREI